MSARLSRIMHLVVAFAVTFLMVSAVAALLGDLWLGLRSMSRIDLWGLGMLIVTPIASALVVVGALLGNRQGTRATVSAAWWAGIVIAVPLVVGVETVEFWSTFMGPVPWFIFIAMVVWCMGAPWYFMRANSALVGDASATALRASYSAPQRER